MFSCENEERELWDNGMYVIPNFKKLIFAGFAGVIKILRETSINNDASHPLYKNILEGNYLLEYYRDRLLRYKKTLHKKFTDIFETLTSNFQYLPSILKPYYFHKMISLIVSGFENKFLEQIETQDFYLKNIFFRQLLLTIPQFMTASTQKNLYLLSAGLPHFSTGCWKNWGRDTFISFNGIFLLTGLYQHGRALILEYARHLRHGLIPNMLQPSRYNSRDAVWWFVYAIKNYLEEVGDYKILEQKVEMIFLSDNQKEHFEKVQSKIVVKKKLIDILQEIFQKHAEGIKFREWNSDQIDECMTDQGFNVSLFINWRNGFVYGGNDHNCLTWMDKMGSSHAAKNRGIPATSRNGAPIELTALLYIGLKMMKMLYQEGISPYGFVTAENGEKWEYKTWKNLVKTNFELYYWIPESETQDDQYKIETSYVFRRGIYKDCLSDKKEGYQLRPNALIAVSLVFNILKRENVHKYLFFVKKLLIVT